MQACNRFGVPVSPRVLVTMAVNMAVCCLPEGTFVQNCNKEHPSTSCSIVLNRIVASRLIPHALYLFRMTSESTWRLTKFSYGVACGFCCPFCVHSSPLTSPLSKLASSHITSLFLVKILTLRQDELFAL